MARIITDHELPFETKTLNHLLKMSTSIFSRRKNNETGTFKTDSTKDHTDDGTAVSGCEQFCFHHSEWRNERYF